MAPGASPGKPRCMVSEGVWCLKVYGAGGVPRQAQVYGVRRCMVSEGVWCMVSEGVWCL